MEDRQNTEIPKKDGHHKAKQKETSWTPSGKKTWEVPVSEGWHSECAGHFASLSMGEEKQKR